MLDLEVLVVKLTTVDGLSAHSGAVREVSSLDHELRDHAVELGALIVQRLSGRAVALLSRAQRAEVLHGLGHSLSEETDGHTASRLAVNLHVKEYLGCDLLQVLLAFLRRSQAERADEAHGEEELEYASGEHDADADADVDVL